MYFDCKYENKKQIMETYKNINLFLYSDEMRNILKCFNRSAPEGECLEKNIEEFLSISNLWDYRKRQLQTKEDFGERARWLISDADLSNEQCEAVLKATNKLGLTGRIKPEGEEYDYVLALGGARYSCLYRPRYAVELSLKMKHRPKALVLLSGSRFVMDSERAATNSYAPNAKTEYDLMNCGLKETLAVSVASITQRNFSNPNKNFSVLKYNSCNGLNIYSISAPSSEPEKRRANSADTFKFFIDQQKPESQAKILLVTSEIYVPYQQLEAIRTLALPAHLLVETVGFPNNWLPENTIMRNASNYLQEIRSTIQAMDRFIKQYPCSH